MKTLNAAALLAAAMLLTAALLLSPFRSAQAQQPGIRILRSRQLPPGFLGNGAAAGALRATAAKPVLTCAITELFGYDFDLNGVYSALDTTSAYGSVLVNGVPSGTWQLAGIIATNDGLASGVLQLNLTNGTVTIDLGPASRAGIRSGTFCRPILGGTGAYARMTGNAGLVSDNSALYVQLGVR